MENIIWPHFGQYWEKLATFYSIIWSHCTPQSCHWRLREKEVIKIDKTGKSEAFYSGGGGFAHKIYSLSLFFTVLLPRRNNTAHMFIAAMPHKMGR